MKVLFLFLSVYLSIFADCKIVKEENSDKEVVLYMDCSYRLGESEAALEAKNNLYTDAKLKTKNKVGELVISELKLEKMNVTSTSILESTTNIISPSIVTIDELQSTQLANMVFLKLKTHVDKRFIKEYFKDIKLRSIQDKHDDIAHVIEDIPQDALMKEAIIKDKVMRTEKEYSDKAQDFKERSIDHLINTMYKDALTIKRKIIRQSPYIDTVRIDEDGGYYSYYAYPKREEKVQAIKADTETNVVINSEKNVQLKERYPSILGIMSNKIGMVDPSLTRKYNKKIVCNQYSAGLRYSVSVIVEFHSDGQSMIDSIEIGDCIDFSLIEENRNLAKYPPVTIIGFEKTKSPEILHQRQVDFQRSSKR